MLFFCSRLSDDNLGGEDFFLFLDAAASSMEIPLGIGFFWFGLVAFK
jgi:hypothetical protein